MIIRDAQMAAFEEYSVRAFEDEMVAHASSFAPELSRIVGADAMREVVRVGLERGRSYGFFNRGPLRLYIELMLAFGSDFDTDPQLRWANPILAKTASHDEMLRATQLHQAMEEYLYDVGGPKNVFAAEALQRVKAIRFEAITERKDASRAIHEALSAAYPQKYAYVGEEVVSQLIQSASASAGELTLPPAVGIGTITGLMFGFGHGVLNDRLYPWVRRTLEDPLVTSALDKLQRLETKVRMYIDAMLSHGSFKSNA
jgi:hypothetical protein